MNFFHHKDLGNHLLQLCPKVVKHPVFSHVQAEYRFIIGENIQYNAIKNNVRDEILSYIETEIL